MPNMSEPERESCSCTCGSCRAYAEAGRSRRPKVFSKLWIVSMVTLGIGLVGIVGPRATVIGLLIFTGAGGLMGMGPLARLNLPAED
jgi:hypothetical protein